MGGEARLKVFDRDADVARKFLADGANARFQPALRGSDLRIVLTGLQSRLRLLDHLDGPILEALRPLALDRRDRNDGHCREQQQLSCACAVLSKPECGLAACRSLDPP
jgi:hypothetical protein